MLDGARTGNSLLEGAVLILGAVVSCCTFLAHPLTNLRLEAEELEPVPQVAPEAVPSTPEGSTWAVRQGAVSHDCGVFLVEGERDGFVETATPGGGLELTRPSLDPAARVELCESMARAAILNTETVLGNINTAQGTRRVTAHPLSRTQVRVSLTRASGSAEVIGLSQQQQVAVQLEQIADTLDGMTRDLNALEGVARGRKRGDEQNSVRVLDSAE